MKKAKVEINLFEKDDLVHTPAGYGVVAEDERFVEHFREIEVVILEDSDEYPNAPEIETMDASLPTLLDDSNEVAHLSISYSKCKELAEKYLNRKLK